MEIRTRKVITLNYQERDILRHAVLVLEELSDHLETVASADEVDEVINNLNDIICTEKWEIEMED